MSSNLSPKESAADSDDEYFEEFHLPNTHENAFVRHVSFRRKVHTTPIHAPDADKIEGLVRTGELVRHDSIRKKILPESDEFEVDDGDDDLESIGIQSFEHRSPILSDEGSKAPAFRIGSLVLSPNSLESNISFVENGMMNSFQDLSLNEFEKTVNIEESTIRKIKECLNVESYKDLLNLCGRLSDLLSPLEVEEVLNNSERYKKYLNNDVLQALSLSYEINRNSLPPISNTNAKVVSTSDNGSLLESGKCIKPLTQLHLVSKPIDGIAAEGIFIETSNKSAKNKIVAPVIDFDASFPDGNENFDFSTSFEESPDFDESTPKKPMKKVISVSKEILNDSSNTEFNSEECENISETPVGKSETVVSENGTSLHGSEEVETDHFGSCLSPPPDLIPELSALEEYNEERHWKNVVVGGAWRRIDMKVIIPYKKCISHGGYQEGTGHPVVVLSSCLMPEKTRRDYHYVMDNLFMYILSFVEQLAADDYILVYLAGGKRVAGPGIKWMRKAYEMIDRKLRKNLKMLLVVHPSFWAQTLVTLSRPFISLKFYHKLQFVHTLTELAQLIPLQQLEIPDAIARLDFELTMKQKRLN